MQCREAQEDDAMGRGIAAGPLARMAERQRVECTGHWPGPQSTSSQNRLMPCQLQHSCLLLSALG